MVFCSLFLSCKISSSLFVAFKAINWSISGWLKRQLSDRRAAISTFEVHVRDIEHLALRSLTKALIIKGHKLLEVSVILTYDPLILSLRSMVKIVLLFFSPPSKRKLIELCMYYTLFEEFVNPLVKKGGRVVALPRGAVPALESSTLPKSIGADRGLDRPSKVTLLGIVPSDGRADVLGEPASRFNRRRPVLLVRELDLDVQGPPSLHEVAPEIHLDVVPPQAKLVDCFACCPEHVV